MDKFIMNKVGDMLKDKAEDAINKALGISSKEDEEEDDDKGFWPFKKDKKKDDDSGIFSFGSDKKDKDDEDDKDGFFSRFLNKDDDEDSKQKKSGFSGLFSEQEGKPEQEGGRDNGNPGQMMASGDGDLLDDLYSIADETSTSN